MIPVDLQSATLAMLAVVGAVNVLTIFRPYSSSQEKFILSVVVALVISFIPADLNNLILNKLKDALTLAFTGSGAYKIAQKAGGK